MRCGTLASGRHFRAYKFWNTNNTQIVHISSLDIVNIGIISHKHMTYIRECLRTICIPQVIRGDSNLVSRNTLYRVLIYLIHNIRTSRSRTSSVAFVHEFPKNFLGKPNVCGYPLPGKMLYNIMMTTYNNYSGRDNTYIRKFQREVWNYDKYRYARKF